MTRREVADTLIAADEMLVALWKVVTDHRLANEVQPTAKGEHDAALKGRIERAVTALWKNEVT